jgi:hypothetical protein
MANFFDSSTDVKYYAPKAAKGTSAAGQRSWLGNLAFKDISYPTQQIAGLTGTEQQAQNLLGDVVAGKTFQDPTTSPLYAGLRQQNQYALDKDVAALRHRQALGGMFRSGAGGRQEADLRSGYQANLNTALGQLYESERNRDNPYTQLAAAAQYGSLPRELQQARNDADYQKLVNDIMAVYQLQAPIAQQMIGNEMWYGPTVTSNPSMFSQIATPLAALMTGASALNNSYGGGAGGSNLNALAQLYQNSLLNMPLAA